MPHIIKLKIAKMMGIKYTSQLMHLSLDEWSTEAEAGPAPTLIALVPTLGVTIFFTMDFPGGGTNGVVSMNFLDPPSLGTTPKSPP